MRFALLAPEALDRIREHTAGPRLQFPFAQAEALRLVPGIARHLRETLRQDTDVIAQMARLPHGFQTLVAVCSAHVGLRGRFELRFQPLERCGTFLRFEADSRFINDTPRRLPLAPREEVFELLDTRSLPLFPAI